MGRILNLYNMNSYTIPILDFFYKRIFSQNEEISFYGHFRVNTFSGTLHLIIEERKK
jgi:hypothetical protein